MIKKVACLESVIDKRTEAVHNDDEKVNVVEPSANCMSIEYTRTLDKAYHFFQDGHVQNVKYHPLPILLTIYAFLQLFYLPSMRKDRIYNIFPFLSMNLPV